MNNQQFKKVSLYFLFLVFLLSGHSLQVFASSDYDHEDNRVEREHGHVGERGGYFADADDIYHYEMFLDHEGFLKIYLYDESAEPIKVTGISSRWTLPGSDYPLKGSFNESESGEYYWAKFPKHDSEVVHILIETIKNDKWIPLEYYLPSGIKGQKA